MYLIFSIPSKKFATTKIIIIPSIQVFLAVFNAILFLAFSCSDEVGFVHPSQFVALNKGLNSSCPPSVSVLESTDGNIGRDTAEDNVEQYDHNIFWNKDHKLAISTTAVLPLYGAAVHAFMSASRQYKVFINLPERTDSVDESANHSSSNCRTFLDNELMRHSKALVILSCDFGSAWNSRFCFSLHFCYVHICLCVYFGKLLCSFFQQKIRAHKVDPRYMG